jgi:putative tricarboxylic transport membrane protein
MTKGDGMRNRTDVIAGALLIIVGIGVGIESIRLKLGTPLTPQPGFFPFIGSVLLIGLAVILLVQGLRRRDGSAQSSGEVVGELRRPLVLIVSLCVYTAALKYVGYVLPTMVLVAVILRVLGVMSWKVLTVTSLGLSVVAYLLFGRVLGIDLPRGVLPFLG